MPFLSNRSRSFALLIVLLGLGCSLHDAKAVGRPSATGTLTEIQDIEGTYTYEITLDDTGAYAVDAFSFASISGDTGQNFLDVEPSSDSAPANWSASLSNAGSSDGWGIQFSTSSSDALASGNTLSGFEFTTTESLSQLEQNSVAYSGSAQTVSEVTGVFNGNSNPFLVTIVAVPEPATVASVVMGAAILCCWRRRRRG